MKKSPLFVTASVGLVVAIALAPTAAFAGRGHGGRGGGGVVGSGPPSGFQHHGFKGHPGFTGHHGFKGHPGFTGHHGFKGHPGFDHRFKGHHGFRPFFAWGAVTVWVPPLYYGYGYHGYGASTYYSPPVYYAPGYAPPAVYAPPAGGRISVAPAPPTPRVVQYPNGRYELRGDGITTPHTWVWIPNPPPPPPEPPAAPPPPAEEPPG